MNVFVDDVPVAGRGEARLPPDLHLLPVRPGVVPAGEEPGLRPRDPANASATSFAPVDLRRVVRRPHDEELVGADEGPLAAHPSSTAFFSAAGACTMIRSDFAVPQEVEGLPGPRLDPAQGRILPGGEDVRQRGEKPELARAAGGQREGAPAVHRTGPRRRRRIRARRERTRATRRASPAAGKNGHGFSSRLDDSSSPSVRTGDGQNASCACTRICLSSVGCFPTACWMWMFV